MEGSGNPMTLHTLASLYADTAETAISCYVTAQ